MTYGGVLEQANRFGRALRDVCAVRPEERVMLLLLDGFAFAAAFWGTIKTGAIAVPVNTLLRTNDYQQLLDGQPRQRPRRQRRAPPGRSRVLTRRLPSPPPRHRRRSQLGCRSAVV